MKQVYIGITWIITLAIAYFVGEWQGLSKAVTVAANTTRSGFSLILIVLAIVAVISAVLAYKTRGYFENRRTPQV